MKLENNSLKYAECKYKIGDYVYVFEAFEIKLRKITSVTFGGAEDNFGEVLYTLITSNSYRENEVFKTKSECEQRILNSFLNTLDNPEICRAIITTDLVKKEIETSAYEIAEKRVHVAYNRGYNSGYKTGQKSVVKKIQDNVPSFIDKLCLSIS